MTYAVIRKMFLQAVGNTPEAQEEWAIHVTHAQRRVAHTPSIDVPEMYRTVTATVPAGSDFIPIANLGVDVFAIMSAMNVSGGFPIYPENSGMMGRLKYLQADTNQPPVGQITHFERDADSIWFRDTPESDTTIAFRVQLQTPEVTDSDLNDSPVLPEQWHMSIIQAAAANFYALHQELNTVMGANGQPAGLNSTRFENQVLATMAQPKSSRAEEDRPRRETMRLTGYQIGPKSRR